MDKKLYTAIAAIVVLVVLIFWGDFILSLVGIKERIQSKEFIGQVLSVSGNSIFLKGSFTILNPKDLKAPRISPDLKEVEVIIDGKTKFVKTLLYLPSAEDLKKTGGRYNPDELKKEIRDGLLQDIKNNEGNLSIIVKSQNNIFNKQRFITSEIDYIEPIFP
mgnify:CR=1 FL=1